MKLKYILGFLIFSVTIISGQSQSGTTNSTFISALMGTVQYGSPHYTNNNNAFAASGGGEFGIPVLNNTYIIGQISYQAISNYQTYLESSHIETNLGVVNELVKTNASFSHLIVSSGLQYTFSIYEDYKIGLSGGVQYSLINQEAYLSSGMLVRSLNNEGFFGYFGGILVEKTFKDKNYSIIGEAQYNYIQSDAVSYTDEFSGMNFFIGGRYYFNSRGI
jgi:hypothetical protein